MMPDKFGNYEVGDLVLSTLGWLQRKVEKNRKMPDLLGRCDCGYQGDFKYQGSQYDKDEKYAFSLYNCPECHSTKSDVTILTNFYKPQDLYSRNKQIKCLH